MTRASAPAIDGGRRFAVLNALLSTGAVAFLAWLLLVHEAGGESADLAFLPAVNASLNACAASLLVAGWIAIRRGHRDLHRALMMSAFAASALFLVSYVVYHYVHGDTRYTGVGTMRLVYFAVLITHVLSSIAIVPMVLAALWLAYKQRFATHKRITRVLTPLWLYVSVTGVLVFLMLRYPATT